MDAVISAGGIPNQEDPLYPYSQGRPKALIEAAGKPLVQWVLDAMSASERVERVVLVGLNDDEPLHCDKPLTWVPDQGELLKNVRRGAETVLEINPEAELVLSVSADIPAITGEIVDWTIAAAEETEHDIYYNLITRDVMEKRFPESNRSFVRLKDAEVCGGDMNVFRADLVYRESELLDRVVDARKNAAKQAALIGIDILLLVLFRRLTMDEAVKRIGKKFGIRGRAVMCPYAEVGMDVDKPFQLKILDEDLAKNTVS